MKNQQWKSREIGAWAVLAAIFATMGLLCNMEYEARLFADPLLEQEAKLRTVQIYFERIFSYDKFYACVIMTGFFFSFYYLRKHQVFQKKKSIIISLCSAVFSIIQVLGKSFMETDGWDNITASSLFLLRSILAFFGWFWFGFLFFHALFYFLDRLEARLSDQAPLKETGSFKKKVRILVLCWLPYEIFFFPGTNNGDTIMQILEYFHLFTHDGLHSMTAWGEGDFIHNHHPYLTTVIFGSFAKLGKALTGSIGLGIALYVLIQLIVFALIFAYIWWRFEQDGLPARLCQIGLWFTALMPAFPLIAICMIKDSLFCIFILLSAIQLYEVIRSDGEILREKKKVIGMMLVGLLLSLTKSQGPYMLLILFAILMIRYPKVWKGILCSCLFPVLFVLFLWTPVFLPAWNVAPAGHQELIGPMLQQTARYVKEHGEEVTKEEKETISKVLDYQKLAKKYDPRLSDPVKKLYHTEASKEELTAYYRVWLQMLLKHPRTYCDATVNTCFSFFYVNMDINPFRVLWENVPLSEKKENGMYLQNVFQRRDGFGGIFILIQKIPGIGLFFSLAFYTWVFLLFLVRMIWKKRGERLLPLIHAFLTILIFIIVPSALSGRYVWPLIVSIPFVISGCFLPDKAEPEDNA